MFLLRASSRAVSRRSELSHERVLAEFGGAQREARVGSGRGGDVRVGREEGFVLSLVHRGGRQQAGVDAHRQLAHDAAGVAQAKGRALQQSSGGAGRGQQVRHGRCWRGEGQDGGLPSQLRAPRQVAGAALRQGERGAREERLLLMLMLLLLMLLLMLMMLMLLMLLPARGEVPVPLQVLNLATHTQRNGQGLAIPRAKREGKNGGECTKTSQLKIGRNIETGIVKCFDRTKKEIH